MSAFGFTFEGLYRLEVEELQDLARLIRGESYYPPKTKQALIRGVIIPFLREAGKANKDASKDEAMRIALVRVGKGLGLECDDWDAAETGWIVQKIRQRFGESLVKQFRDLDDEEREAILNEADGEIRKSALQMGLTLLPATAVVAGELTGFGIYLSTTQALAALSTAIGVTFPWAVYQGATTALGVVLGPVGWVLAGTGVLAGGAAYLSKRLKNREEKLKIVVVSLILFIRDPYEWFGLGETAPMQEVKTAYRALMKTFHPDKLERGLPDWVKNHFNELLLQTQESYERVQRHKEEAS